MATNYMPSIESSHCVEFVREIISRAFERYGMEWESKDQTDFRSSKRRKTAENKTNPAINPEFIDTVLRLQTKMQPAFDTSVSEAGNIFERSSTFVDFIHAFSKRLFENADDFMHGFIHYCAFVVNLALHCIEKGLPESVETIVYASESIYENYMKENFEKLGFRASPE